MAERLVILSDIWGAKKGLWITSYLGNLQQYYDIIYYDTQQLAGLDVLIHSRENLNEAFLHGGLHTAVAQILKMESIPSHYLTFGSGGNVAWQAALKGLPAKSIYAVSPYNIHLANEMPCCPISLLYGEIDESIPSLEWSEMMEIPVEAVPRFGKELYSDEKIIQMICLKLLESVMKKHYQV
jgi:hypothetical protein